MEITETGKIKGMDSNKGQCEIHESNVYRAEKRFARIRAKDITGNIVQNPLMTLDGISAEDMQKERLRHREKGNIVSLPLLSGLSETVL